MAQKPTTEYQALELLKRGLQENIHEVLEDMLMKEAIQEYTDKIQPVIREHVKKVALDGIYNFMDHMSIDSEIRFYWNDKKESDKLPKRNMNERY